MSRSTIRLRLLRPVAVLAVLVLISLAPTANAQEFSSYVDLRDWAATASKGDVSRLIRSMPGKSVSWTVWVVEARTENGVSEVRVDLEPPGDRTAQKKGRDRKMCRWVGVDQKTAERVEPGDTMTITARIKEIGAGSPLKVSFEKPITAR